MKKLIATLLVFALAGVAGADFVENFDGAEWSNMEAIGAPAPGNNGWISPGSDSWIYDGKGYLGTRGVTAKNPSNGKHYSAAHYKLFATPLTSGDGHQVSAHLHVSEISSIESEWDDTKATIGVQASDGTGLVVEFRGDDQIRIQQWGDGGAAEYFVPNAGIVGIDWLECQITVNLDSDTLTAKWRDLDDAAWGYAAGSSWNDLGVLGQIPGGALMAYEGDFAGKRIRMYGDYPADPCSTGRVDNVNIAIPDVVLLAGDVNDDGFVGGADLTKILTNWGRTGMSRRDGDLSGDGTVSGEDYTEVVGNWGGTPPPEPPAGIPEPAALALLLIGGLLGLSWRGIRPLN